MRHKKDGAALVLFNQNTGLKLRLSEEDYTKSSTPELVDMKITNFCPYGCSFCYQSSTRQGQHASLARLKVYSNWLAAAEVFEVAIGGGEPSMHPDFNEFLQYCRITLGIIPNFTTFGAEWTKTSTLEVVEATVGGIGVSVHSMRDVARYERVRKAVKRPQVLAQHVFGTQPVKEVLELLSSVDHLLLLGYKSVGFGAGGKPLVYHPDEIDALFAGAKRLSVDTAFLDLYGDQLDRLGIPKELRSSPEGKFSCYIDAVTGRMGPSSYGKVEDTLLSYEDFINNYQGY